ncbi:MAG: TonB-dependent receptor [Hyphomicrobiales bacterium]|nr:TonB-dependent receptor [Hyphomicrobiales bacterium]
MVFPRRAAFSAAVCLACFSLPVEARAQTPVLLEGVVVTASRSAESAAKVGSSITVIGREEIERARASNVKELLETVPGLAVNEAGGAGGTASVFIRGADSDHTQVLIDGVRVNDPGQASGEFDFSLLTLANVERIEVLRGPQSGLYGSDAIGGVINIITRKGEGPLQGVVEAYGGRYGTHAERGAISGSHDGIAVSAAATNYRTSGFSRSKLGREDDGAEKQSANIRMDADLTANAGITVALGRYHVDADVDTNVARGEDDTAKRLLTTGALTGRWDLMEGALRNKITLFANETVRTFFDDDASSRAGLQPQTDVFEGQRFGVEAQSDITVRAVDRLTLGGRVERETGRQTTETTTGNTVAFSGEERTSAAFGLYEFNPFEALTLTAAARTEDFGSAGVEDTYRFTGAWRFMDGAKLRASYGTAAKAPTLSQRFANSALTVGNPDLAVEKSTGFDAGVDQSLLSGKLTLSATYFQNEITDLIEFFDADGFGVGARGTFENIRAAETSGWEFAAGVVPASWLRLDASYTYLDAVDAETGAPLQRRPEHTASVRATFTPTEAFKLTASALYVGERFNNADRANPLDDYVRVDLNAAYAFTPNAELFMFVENLGGADYEEIQNFNTADRSVFAGLRARF